MRQPAPRCLTIVRVSQPGPHLNPPAAVCESWVASQRAWVDVALNQAVELSGTSARGAAWSSSVHVLGVAHGSAANAWSVHEVAAAVRPDAVGSENDSSDKTLRTRLTKAAQSAPMLKLVDRLMDTPIESYAQAHGQLTAEERNEWEQGLGTARFGLGPSTSTLAISHRLLGQLAYSDPIGAAFIARKLGAQFDFIDCPNGRSKSVEVRTKLQWEEYVLAFWAKTEEALGETLASSFRRWEESDPGSKVLHLAVHAAMAEAVMPEAMPYIVTADPVERREANAQRERGMCRSIIELCSGKLSVAPRKQVMVIVGRAHVAPLIQLLSAQHCEALHGPGSRQRRTFLSWPASWGL
ncbi:hypothetical protein FOA52_007904 [Chlamydomonas sp. UWO 241]|nr:hypothetical protein FOA52_007904 [Chlamydomonas sp. UWO 241]